MRISFISKVTRIHKATTAGNNTSLCSTISVLFLEFHLGRPGWNLPYEQTTKFVPVTEPAWLPGSYEEALGQRRIWSFQICTTVNQSEVITLACNGSLWNQAHMKRPSDNAEFGHFTWLLSRGRQRNLHRFITHAYTELLFGSLNRSGCRCRRGFLKLSNDIMIVKIFSSNTTL